MKMKEHVLLGDWTEGTLDTLLQASSSLPDISSRIDFLSKQFLGVPYKEQTLIGGPKTAEVFVINLQGLDCFTFVDYIESLRVSTSFPEFRKHLRTLRYRDGEVAYSMRNHFFTDWKVFNAEHVDDITEVIAGADAGRIVKILNEKDDASRFLAGVPCREQEVSYVPSGQIDDVLIARLRTGDYAGMYTEQRGLDVSHIGIIIRRKEGDFLRHASSRLGKVVDEDLKSYISGKPGIIVLRPKAFVKGKG